MKKFFYLMLAGMIGSVALTACDDDDDDVKSIPQRYAQALDAKYPGASAKAKWEQKKGYYVAEFPNEARCEVDAWFDSDAKWVMSETDLGKDLFLMPVAVNKGYEATTYASSGWIVDDIDWFERPDIEFYVIEIEKAGNADRDLYFSPDGTQIKDIVSPDTDITPTTPII